MNSEVSKLVVASTGLRSSLGNAVNAAAAYRCGVSRLQELPEWPYFDNDTLNEQFIKAHSAMGLCEGFQGYARVLKLYASALRDVVNNVRDLELKKQKLSLILCFSEYMQYDEHLAVINEEFEKFYGKLLQESGVELSPTEISIYYGVEGVFSSLTQAQNQLTNGECGFCLIGSVDSFLLTDRLGQLVSTNKINSANNPQGLVPGEAGGFILLETEENAKGRGVERPLVISALEINQDSNNQPSEQLDTENSELAVEQNQQQGTANEENNEEQKAKHSIDLTGNHITDAVNRALSLIKIEEDRPGIIYSDFNGDRDKAVEFANARIRISQFHHINDWRVLVPATNFGDTGVVFPLLSLSLLNQANKRNYSKNESALIVASNEADAMAITVRGNYE